jgi:hypothetical protein
MRHLQELYLQYKDHGLVILGCNASDDKQIALEFMRENGAEFPTILDSSDAATKVSFQDYRGSGVPLNYIIDREGKIVDAWYGYEEGHPRAMAALQKTGGELAEAIHHKDAVKSVKAAGEVTAAAKRLFDALRAADYDRDWLTDKDGERFPAKDVEYAVKEDYSAWVRWVCDKFKANPIEDVQLGEVFSAPNGLPTVHFELRLKDGEVLKGDLSFRWDSQKNQWIGKEGLDWHLPSSP